MAQGTLCAIRSGGSIRILVIGLINSSLIRIIFVLAIMERMATGGRSGVGWCCRRLPWGWNAPVYYDDYGDAVTLPSDGGSYDYAPENAPAAPAQGDWLPLGVFAVGQDLGEAQDSDLFMQLALSKEGEISGTYYNALTDDTHPIEGSVDSGTQEAAWKISDDPYSPIMTTGLYNLTQDTATIQVYFSDAPQQTWFLARVNE